MSTTQAFCPAGTTVKFASAGVGGTPTYDKTIGEVVSIKKTGQKMSTDDATHLGSPSNYKELIAGLKEGGTVALEYNFVPGDAGQVAVAVAFEAGELLPFQIAIGDAGAEGTLTFNALITEYGNYQFQTGKKASDSLQLTISGPVTYTP
jgi:predicted secreted protein